MNKANNENKLMANSNNKAIEHHTEELKKILNQNIEVPAWVVAKLERSATDISDVTHYLEGSKGDKFEGGGRINIVNEGKKFDKNKYKGILGDFDKDGIQNADDPHPSKAGDIKTVEELKLSDVLKNVLNVKKTLDKSMYKAIDILDEYAPESAKIYARTKTPYSIINKLVDKRMIVPDNIKRGLTDLIGTTITVKDKVQLDLVRNKIENSKDFKVFEIEDFYKTPNDGYRAIHYILLIKNKDGVQIPIELQLKTDRMKEFNILSHPAYKAKSLNKEKSEELSSLIVKADNGDSKAMNKFNELMKDKDAVEKSLFTNKKMKTGGAVEHSLYEVIDDGGDVIESNLDEQGLIDFTNEFFSAEMIYDDATNTDNFEAAVNTLIEHGYEVKSVYGNEMYQNEGMELRMYKNGGGINNNEEFTEIDLFLEPEFMPESLSNIFDKYFEKYGEPPYSNDIVNKLLQEVNAKGYTFDVDMSGDLIQLRRENEEFRELEMPDISPAGERMDLGGGISNFGKPGTGFDNPKYNNKKGSYSNQGVMLKQDNNLKTLGAKLVIKKEGDENFSWNLVLPNGSIYESKDGFVTQEDAINNYLSSDNKMKQGGGVDKVGKVMHEFKEGKLHSGSKKGPIVTNRKQALAIALSEAAMSNKKMGWSHKK